MSYATDFYHWVETFSNEDLIKFEEFNFNEFVETTDNYIDSIKQWGIETILDPVWIEIYINRYYHITVIRDIAYKRGLNLPYREISKYFLMLAEYKKDLFQVI